MLARLEDPPEPKKHNLPRCWSRISWGVSLARFPNTLPEASGLSGNLTRVCLA